MGFHIAQPKRSSTVLTPPPPFLDIVFPYIFIWTLLYNFKHLCLLCYNFNISVVLLLIQSHSFQSSSWSTKIFHLSDGKIFFNLHLVLLTTWGTLHSHSFSSLENLLKQQSTLPAFTFLTCHPKYFTSCLSHSSAQLRIPRRLPTISTLQGLSHAILWTLCSFLPLYHPPTMILYM
jgi:hypothetical protein